MKNVLLGMILGVLGVVSLAAIGAPFDLVTPVTDSYSQIEPATFITGFSVPKVSGGVTVPQIQSDGVDAAGVVKGVLTVKKVKGSLECSLTGHMARAGQSPFCSGLTVEEFDSFVAARRLNADTLWQKMKLKKP